MRSLIRSSFFLIEGRFPQAENNFVIFPIRLFRRRVPVHHMKKALSNILVVACLFLAAAGSLLAKRQAQEKESQPASSSTESAPLNYEFFKEKVEPVFLFKRPGHARCVVCHTINHVPLHLVPLSPGSIDVERRAVAPELRIGPAGSCARQYGEPAAQTIRSP